MSQKILIFDPKSVKKKFGDLISKKLYIFFVKVLESLDIFLESSAYYESDTFDQFLSTVIFRLVKNENLICRPTNHKIENSDFFL